MPGLLPNSAAILMVEDDDDDAFMIRLAFQKANVINRLLLVRSGDQALCYFSGQGQYAERETYPLPGLLLLDLKLPGMSGFEVLEWVRGRPQFRELPVVVLTSSTDVRDANRAFRLGANSFVIKPADFLWMAEFNQALSGSWLWMNLQAVPGTEPAA
jgi:CheY-like chemotaxis protein